MSQQFKDTVQVIFEIVMILASLGVTIALLKSVMKKIKNALLYFANVEQRLTALEKRNQRKRKTKN